MTELTNLFLSIVSLSITASIVIVGILAVRALLKRFPKSFSYALWLLLLVRLVCPFKIPFRFSLTTLLPQNLPSVHNTSLNTLHSVTAPSSVTNLPTGSALTNPNTSTPFLNNYSGSNPVSSTMTITNILAIIWLIGIVALCVYSVYSYLLIKRKVSSATLIRYNIYETDQITTAFVCGFIKPKIYLPTNLNNQNFYYILAHEQVHIKRRDFLMKPFSYLLIIFHWFNPLMWLSFVLMSKDMEMSCDEKVIQLYGYNIQKDYSYSLLSFSCKDNRLISFSPLAFSENNAKSRIKNIMKYKKPAFSVIILSLMIVIASAVFLLTDSDAAVRPATKDQLTNTNEFTGNTNSLNTTKNVIPYNPQLKTTIEDISTKSYTDTTANEVETNLTTIMSSPKTSSKPYDYINAHRSDYDSIIKIGDEALTYLLIQLRDHNATGLRGYIIVELCKDMLGSSYSLPKTYDNPEDWYYKLIGNQKILLGDYTYDGKNLIEKLVYRTIIENFGSSNQGFTIVAPKIFGSYDEIDYLKVFVTANISTFEIYNKNVTNTSGSVIPMALTYQKTPSGNYKLVQIDQAMDGNYFAPSIQNFCTMPVSHKSINGLADTMVNHYHNYQDISDLLITNLKKHLKKNKLNDISYYSLSGEMIFMQSGKE